MQTYSVLSNGVKMPMLGFGTYLLDPKQAAAICLEALSLGYRLLDTAAVYRNEAAVGKAIAQSEIARNEIFVTTKIPPTKTGYDNVLTSAEDSLKNLNLEFVDLLLLHWPGTAKLPLSDPRNRALRHESWKITRVTPVNPSPLAAFWIFIQAMESLYKNGKAKAIGVSNYTVNHLKQLQEDGIEVLPMVNQIERHPFCLQQDVVDYCASVNCVVQSYSPLGQGRHELLTHPAVLDIAKEARCTPAQVLLQWQLHSGFPVSQDAISFFFASVGQVGKTRVFRLTYMQTIPKTVHSARLRENFEAQHVHLVNAQLERLNNLSSKDNHYAWNPNTVK